MRTNCDLQLGFLSRIRLGWADRGILVSVQGAAHRVGHAGDLLFEFAVGGLRLGLAIAFAAFAIWAVWLSRRRRMPRRSPCCSSAWSCGGSPFLPRTIAIGGRRSR